MDLADHFRKISVILTEHRSSIINEWEKKVRLTIPSAKHQSTPTIVHHLPYMLENLTDLFKDDGISVSQKISDITYFNRIHGEQRATQTNFSLEEVLKEFSLLRETIIEHLYPLITLELDSAKVIHQYVDQSIANTVLEFERLQNNKIIQQKNDLEVEKQLRQRFISALTHDLRTPLAAALMSAEMVQRKSEPTAFQQKYLGKINHNLARMENMIQDFLDVTLIKSGHPAPIKFSEFNLNALIGETVEDLITIHGARFVFDAHDDLNVYLGKRSIRRIVENLASNAIKYGSQTGIVKIDLKKTVDNFVLSVHNTGNPISQEDLKVLFNQFVRTKSATESDNKGWGLGLPLVKGLVDAHKGTIQVTSDIDHGTKFSISLPLRVIT